MDDGAGATGFELTLRFAYLCWKPPLNNFEAIRPDARSPKGHDRPQLREPLGRTQPNRLALLVALLC